MTLISTTCERGPINIRAIEVTCYKISVVLPAICMNTLNHYSETINTFTVSRE